MKNTFATTNNLPALQVAFLNQFDGTLKSICQFENIAQILNPCFTGHFFYVSGDTDENTITTKHTDGSSSRYGSQTQQLDAIAKANEAATPTLNPTDHEQSK
jgi:hypothetical protein